MITGLVEHPLALWSVLIVLAIGLAALPLARRL